MALHDVRTAHLPFFQELVHVFPSRTLVLPDPSRGYYLQVPTEDQISKIAEKGTLYFEATGVLGNYLSDVQVALQNELLGGLFSHRVPTRQPLNPKLKVVTLNSASVADLARYFEEETEHGKAGREAAARYRQSA